MKKLLATGGMLAYILLFNTNGALATSIVPEINATDIQGPKHHQGGRKTKNSEEKIARLADKLNLDVDILQEDLKSHLSIKQILKKHGITKNQLREIRSR